MNTVAIMSAGLALSLLASCANLTHAGGATVCPECETVLVEDIDVSQGTNAVAYQSSHKCPGCQGALVTLFKEGKLQHRCSICSKNGFSCPINHPVKTPNPVVSQP